MGFECNWRTQVCGVWKLVFPHWHVWAQRGTLVVIKPQVALYSETQNGPLVAMASKFKLWANFLVSWMCPITGAAQTFQESRRCLHRVSIPLPQQPGHRSPPRMQRAPDIGLPTSQQEALFEGFLDGDFLWTSWFKFPMPLMDMTPHISD